MKVEELEAYNARTKTVPLAKFELLKMEGYLKEFYRLISTGITHKEAYHKTEAELRKYFFVNRYKSYQSFKSSKAQYLRIKKASLKKPA